METIKRSRGRPAHIPIESQRRAVQLLASSGIPAHQIAQAMGIGRRTLFRHYAAELQRGRAMVEAELVRGLFRIAGGSDAVALKAIKFSLRARFGWSEYAPLEGR